MPAVSYRTSPCTEPHTRTILHSLHNYDYQIKKKMLNILGPCVTGVTVHHTHSLQLTSPYVTANLVTFQAPASCEC